MTDSLICNEEAQFILQRELAAIAARSCVIHDAQIPKYVDNYNHLFSEQAEAIIKKITNGV